MYSDHVILLIVADVTYSRKTEMMKVMRVTTPGCNVNQTPVATAVVMAIVTLGDQNSHNEKVIHYQLLCIDGEKVYVSIN